MSKNWHSPYSEEFKARMVELVRAGRTPVSALPGSAGDAYDNALCERFIGSIECELIEGTSLQGFTYARREVFGYVEGWYNPHRRHSGLSYESTINYEQDRQLAA